jgi:hypothetical protein
MQPFAVLDTIEVSHLGNPLIRADHKLNATDEDLVRVAISRTATEADKIRRSLNQQFLLEDHLGRGLIKQHDFVVGLQQPQIRLRARCTINVKHFVSVARDVLSPHCLARHAATVGNEEFVTAANDVELLLEDLQQRLWLESPDLIFQGFDNDASLCFEKQLFLLSFDCLEISQIPREIRDALQIFLVKRIFIQVCDLAARNRPTTFSVES